MSVEQNPTDSFCELKWTLSTFGLTASFGNLLTAFIFIMIYSLNVKSKLDVSQNTTVFLLQIHQPQKWKDKRRFHIFISLFHRTCIVTDILCALQRCKGNRSNKSRSSLEKSKWLLFESFEKLSLAHFVYTSQHNCSQLNSTSITGWFATLTLLIALISVSDILWP